MLVTHAGPIVQEIGAIILDTEQGSYLLLHGVLVEHGYSIKGLCHFIPRQSDQAQEYEGEASIKHTVSQQFVCMD